MQNWQELEIERLKYFWNSVCQWCLVDLEMQLQQRLFDVFDEHVDVKRTPAGFDATDQFDTGSLSSGQ